MKKPVEEYQSLQETAIKGESQQVVISTAFTLILSHIKEAELHCNAGSYQAMSTPISKAIVLLQALGEGLIVTDETRQLANQLNSLYAFSIRKLANGLLEHDVQSLLAAESVLKELQAGWNEGPAKEK